MAFNKKEYDISYSKEHIKRKFVPFNDQNPEDAELLAWLEHQPNVTKYIKALIRDDLEHHKARDRMNAETDRVRAEVGKITFPAVDGYRDEEACRVCQEEGHRIFVTNVHNWEVRIDVETRKVLTVRDLTKFQP